MLESLKAIDQDQEKSLDQVISAFKKGWERRNQLTGVHITHFIEKNIAYSISEKIHNDSNKQAIWQRLNQKYKDHFKLFEQDLFKKIKSLFRHNIYEVSLLSYSVLEHDLFAKQTWALLGLTKEQLVTAGTFIGGTMGAIADTATGGITFGVFTTIGGILGAASALFGGKKMITQNPKGFKLGGEFFQLGPNKNIQLFYIFLDRALLYYSQIINRPYGRRDLHPTGDKVTKENEKQEFSHRFTSKQKDTCTRFFKTLTGRAIIKKRKKAALKFAVMVETILLEIAVR
jgi:hypothetical protein